MIDDHEGDAHLSPEARAELAEFEDELERRFRDIDRIRNLHRLGVMTAADAFALDLHVRWLEDQLVQIELATWCDR
jgi:hypothetical protein